MGCGSKTADPRFKRIGPNAMRGKGIGAARGRATIQRGELIMARLQVLADSQPTQEGERRGRTRVSDDRSFTWSLDEVAVVGEAVKGAFSNRFEPIIAACTEKCNEHTHETPKGATQMSQTAPHITRYLVRSTQRTIPRARCDNSTTRMTALQRQSRGYVPSPASAEAPARRVPATGRSMSTACPASPPYATAKAHLSARRCIAHSALRLAHPAFSAAAAGCTQAAW